MSLHCYEIELVVSSWQLLMKLIKKSMELRVLIFYGSQVVLFQTGYVAFHLQHIVLNHPTPRLLPELIPC